MRKPATIPAQGIVCPKRIVCDEEAAFVTFYKTFYLDLYSYSFYLTNCRETAEDVVQGVFLKLWYRLQKAEEIHDIKLFLFRMTHNEVVDQLRKQGNKKKLIGQLSRTAEISRCFTEEMVDANECLRLLREAIALLPPQRKKVYVLRKVEGWEIGRIASHMGIAVRTVKETLRQAIRSVREYILTRTEFRQAERQAIWRTILCQMKTRRAA